MKEFLFIGGVADGRRIATRLLNEAGEPVPSWLIRDDSNARVVEYHARCFHLVGDTRRFIYVETGFDVVAAFDLLLMHYRRA